jgi:hypothetical protein
VERGRDDARIYLRTYAAKDTRIRELEEQRKDWIRWKELAAKRIAKLEKVVNMLREDQASFQRWTLGMPKDIYAALREVEE